MPTARKDSGSAEQRKRYCPRLPSAAGAPGLAFRKSQASKKRTSGGIDQMALTAEAV